MKDRIKRMSSELDSIQHATFNGAVHWLPVSEPDVNCKANCLTGDIISTVSLRICVQ